jgi:hypothetical protein
MQLIDILNIPAKYRLRYKKIKEVLLSNFKIEIKNDYRIFQAETGQGPYQTMIAFNKDEKIRPNSEIKVYCGCKSFEFEFADTIDRDNSLLIQQEKPVKVSNKIGVLTGCKHLIFLGQFIFQRRTIFDREV